MNKVLLLLFQTLLIIFNICCCVKSQFQSYLHDSATNTKEAEQFLYEFDKDAIEMCNRIATSEWKFATNGSDYNRRRMREQQSLSKKFECISWKRANNLFNISTMPDSSVRRKFERIVRQGKCGLDERKLFELSEIVSQMKERYNNIRICPFRPAKLPLNVYSSHDVSSLNSCNLKLDPDLVKIMELSRNEPELKYIWEQWREQIGPPIRNSFMRYIDLSNQAAVKNGFDDAGKQMQAIYDDSEFYFTVQDLWAQVQPLYKQLFTFVRRGLVRRYGEDVLRPDGPIPAHLLGNMWGQNWYALLDIIRPYPPVTPDITGELMRQGYTPLRFFQSAEEFFTSLGLSPMLPEFWRNSILNKSNVSNARRCKASAWDFCNNVDFRIMQCTEITFSDFVTAHHEMAHIQYYMHYATQPFIYREGPNPAYHEAIAGAISLCVGGPIHLQRIGLLSNSLITSNGNSMINIEYLLKIALEKLPFMAFSLAVEKWRWHIFEKGPFDMNAKWWNLRLRYEGIIPPGTRSQEHFDAGAKYHIVSDQDYIKYFVATVLQFQIFAELCQVSGHIGPLHTCDFYRSREAGRILSEVMQHGASISSSQLLKIFTRGKTSRISANALIEFFRPLEAWLEQQNRNETIIGWNSNMNDVALFQSLNNVGPFTMSPILTLLLTIFLVINNFILN